MNDDTVVEIAQILYRNYQAEYDKWKEVRTAPVNVKEEDWELFHEQRLRNAMMNRDTAFRIFEEFKKDHRQVLNGAFQ